MSLLLASCGGGGGNTYGSVPATGRATLGAEGGTVSGPDGAVVEVPAGAASAPVTVRIAKDATDMPALPARLTSVGDVWAVTPHGAVFSEAVLVRLPKPVRSMAPNERLRIAKVSPGGEWELLDPAVEGDTLVVKVRSFSFFVPVAESYAQATVTTPPLVVTLQSATCSPGPCNAVGPDSTELTVVASSDGGALPLGCGNATLSLIRQGIVATFVGPDSYELSASASSYTFRAQVNGPVLTQSDGSRASNGIQSQMNLVVQCSGPPAVNGHVASVPVYFPAKTPGNAVEPQMAIEVTSLSCNGGVCLNLMGTQAVRVTVRVEPGALASSTCPGTEELALMQGYWGTRTTLARAEGAMASAGSPARLVGGDFSFGVPAAGLPDSFNLLAPVPVGNVPLYIVRQCPSATLNVLPSILRTLYFPFVTPQQATPPAFSTQPRPMSVRAGQTASFTAVVTGFPAPALQWHTRLRDTDAWADVPGATAGTLTTAPGTLADTGRQFKLVASNTSGSVESNVVTLSVYLQDTAPIINHQPVALSVLTGSDAAFAVAASGTGALSYQWQFNGQPITGANAPVLKLSAAGSAQAGSYRVVVSNAAGAVTSDAAILTVSAVPQTPAPRIEFTYTTMTVALGSELTLSARIANATGLDNIEWYRDGVVVRPSSGPVGTSMLIIPSVRAADAGVYSVRMGASAAMNVAEVQVSPNVASSPVTIAVQPAPQVQVPLGSATFAVAVSGSGPLAFQWLKDGVAINGATQAVLNLSAVTAADVGSYSVRVTNSLGSVTSNAAPLVVLGAPAVTSQPQAQSVVEGATATFTVAASGHSLRYQWLLNGLPIGGATASSYTTPALSLSDSGGVYSVLVYNGAGLVISQGALLTVTARPPQALFGQLAGYASHYCAVRADHTLACWGAGVAGQLGYGTFEDRPTPRTVVGLSQVSAVAVGGSSSCAIHGADVLSCWGALPDQATPVAVFGTPTPVAAVAVGSDHGCLVYKSSSASVACWGDLNDYGQLGGEPSVTKPRPADVLMADGTVLQDVAEIAAGDSMSCALQRSGAVWCWGMDTFFQVRTTPQRVLLASGSPLVARSGLVVGASQPHACALGEGGSVWCWGFNGNAELGDGTTNSRDAAAQVAGLSGALALSAGPSHTCAMLATGVQCWGLAFMGSGAAFESLTRPLPAGLVASLTGSVNPAVALAPGSAGNCVLLANGDVQCWGSNGGGQLGVGDLLDRLVPTSTLAGAVFRRP